MSLLISLLAIYSLRQVTQQFANVFEESKLQITQQFTTIHKQQSMLKIGLVVVLLIIAVTAFLNNKKETNE